MNMTRDRVHSIVWAIVFAVSAALLLALTFRVNAVRSEVRLAERRIMAVRQDKLTLETEFQTRANQQQLAAINAVEFGYKAPGAGQYVDGERQLAALSRPIAPALIPGTSAPVRMARADTPAVGSLPAVLAPLAGKALAGGSGTRFLSDRNEVLAGPEARARTVPGKASKATADTARSGLARAGATKTGSTKTGSIKSGSTKSGSTKSGMAALAAAKPVATKSATTKSATTKPAATKLAAAKPSGARPTLVEPAKRRAPDRAAKRASEKLALGDDAVRGGAKGSKQ